MSQYLRVFFYACLAHKRNGVLSAMTMVIVDRETDISIEGVEKNCVVAVANSC